MSYDYYGSYGNYGYDTTTAGILGGAFAGLMIGAVIGSILTIIVMWKLFVKAGKPGWAAIVPFYNLYVLFEITWGNGWLFLVTLAAIVPVLGYIVVFVFYIITMLKLAKAFGKDTGFGVGLIFLSLIFMAILAFDSSTYLGVPQKDGGTQTPPSPAPAENQESTMNTAPSEPAPEKTEVPTPEPVVTPNETTTLEQNPVQEPAPTTEGVKYCPNCGAQLQPGTAFCQNCGTKITN